MRKIFLLSLFLQLFVYSDDSFLKSAKVEYGASFGDYIGIRKGYAEIGIFEVLAVGSEWNIFLEGRGFLLSPSDWAASIGLGVRKPFCEEILFGANIYYDYRSLHKDEDFRRSFGSLGLGFEILSNWFDLRSNIYLPVKETQKSTAYFCYPEGYFAHFNTIHTIPYGIDAEISKRLNFCSRFYALGALGGYGYCFRHTKCVSGTMARLKLGWGDYLSLQARYSYDKHFHSNVQGSVLFSLPFEELGYCFESITKPVQRNYILFTEKRCCWKWSW